MVSGTPIPARIAPPHTLALAVLYAFLISACDTRHSSSVVGTCACEKDAQSSVRTKTQIVIRDSRFICGEPTTGPSASVNSRWVFRGSLSPALRLDREQIPTSIQVVLRL